MAKKKKSRKSVPKGKKRGPKAARQNLAKRRRSPAQRLLASLKKAKRTTLTDYPGPRVLDGEEVVEKPKPSGVGTDWGGAQGPRLKE